MIPKADPTVAAVGHPGVSGAPAEVETGAAVADGVGATAAGELVPEPPQAASAVTAKNAASAQQSDLPRDLRDPSCASTFDAVSHCIGCPPDTAPDDMRC